MRSIVLSRQDDYPGDLREVATADSVSLAVAQEEPDQEASQSDG